VGHLDELVADVARLRDPVVVGGLRGGADENVSDARLAHVATPVIGREPLDEQGSELRLAVHEHVRVRDEDVIEDDHRFLPGELGVARVRGSGFRTAGVAGLSAVDVGDARRIGGDRGDHGVVPVGLEQPHRRHRDDPVRVDTPGLVGLRPADGDALGRPRGHPDEQVRVGLPVRRQRAVALDVGHGAPDDQVAPVHRREEGLHPLVVRGAVLLVDLIGDRVEGVEGVHAHASLEARPGDLSELALHLVLQDEVLGVGTDVEEPAHGLPGEGRDDGRELGMGLGEVVGGGDGVDRGPDDRVVDGLVDLLPHQEHPELAAPQALDVLGAGADRPGRAGRSVHRFPLGISRGGRRDAHRGAAHAAPDASPGSCLPAASMASTMPW
jgi:hypothetical protein